jgi:hypothetical protein
VGILAVSFANQHFPYFCEPVLTTQPDNEKWISERIACTSSLNILLQTSRQWFGQAHSRI